MLDERRRMCVAQRERASREIGEITRVRWAEASARGEQLGRGATRPRVLDERRRMCVARRLVRVTRDWREHLSALGGEARARGEQLGRGATRPRVLDERRRICASRNDERASRETGENALEWAERLERVARWQTRVLDERRRMCVAQRRARVARDGREHSSALRGGWCAWRAARARRDEAV